MSKIVTFLGLIGTFTFGITSYMNYRVYKRLEDNRKTTIEMFFLRSEIGEALKFMLVSILIFGLSGSVSIMGLRTGNLLLAGAIDLGIAVFFVAYMLFFATLYLSTTPKREFSFFDGNIKDLKEADDKVEEAEDDDEDE